MTRRSAPPRQRRGRKRASWRCLYCGVVQSVSEPRCISCGAARPQPQGAADA